MKIKTLKFENCQCWHPDDCDLLEDKGNNKFIYTNEGYSISYEFKNDFKKCTITNMKHIDKSFTVNVELIDME